MALALLGYLFLHLAYVGLPSFLKEPLLNVVREQGLELDYSRIRFLPLRGVVVDRVNVRLQGDPDLKPFFVEQLSLRFDWMPLLELAPPRLEAATFTGGSAARAVQGGPGEPAAVLRLDRLACELEFVSQDDWRLTWLTADLNGLTLEAMGSFSEVTRYLKRRRPQPALVDFHSPPLARALNEMDTMVFTAPPRVELGFAVNGEQLPKSVVQLRCTTAGARSAWGQFDDVQLSVDVQPARNAPGRSHGAVRFQSAAARTLWGALDSLRFRADVEFLPTNALPDSVRWTLAANSLVHEAGRLGRLRIQGTTIATNGTADPSAIPTTLEPSRAVARREAPGGVGFATDLDLKAVDFHSRWITVSNLTLATHLWNGTHDWRPLAMDWRLTASEATSDAARTRLLDLRGSALPVATADQPVLQGFWTNAAPWRAQALISVSDLHVRPGHFADQAQVLLDWKQGLLRFTQLEVRLPAGSLSGSGWVTATNGDLGLDLRGDVKPLQLAAVLPPAAWQQWTNRGLRPENSVEFNISGHGQVPSWSRPPADLLRDLMATLTAHGVLGTTNFGIGNLTLQETRVPFEFTPDAFRITGLKLAMAPAQLTGDFDADLASGRWHARLDGSLNPHDLGPLIQLPGLDTQLDLLRLDRPPSISGDVWGNWNDPQQTGAALRFALTNATYRNEPITELRTAMAYTNQQLVFTGTEALQGTNVARVPVLHFDLPANLLHITNGFSTLEVASVVRAIGPNIAKLLAPYHFLEAPTVRVNGSIPLTEDVQGNVEFQASVPLLQWWYFEFDKLLATVRWAGDRISITNLAGGFYGGLISAHVEVSVTNRSDAVFGFNASYTDVDLQRVVADLTSDTNRLEGVLSGEITVLEGHGDEIHPWKGFGNAQLRNGYLWNLPLFGLLSPAFDSISPGLGAAKFRDGNALFTLTNRSVVFNRVELLSPAMRLQMRGPVDFDGRLNLVLEAEPLRDLPLFGPLVNLVLSPFSKLLEYDITGTLGKPEAELRHVPSFLLIPLQPFTTLKSVFQGSPSSPKEGNPPPPSPPSNPPK